MLGALFLGFGGLVLLKTAFAPTPDPRQALASILSGEAFTPIVTGMASRRREPEVTGTASRRRESGSVLPTPTPTRRTSVFRPE